MQDSLPLTLRGNTDHGPHPYHARSHLAREMGSYPYQVTHLIPPAKYDLVLVGAEMGTLTR